MIEVTKRDPRLRSEIDGLVGTKRAIESLVFPATIIKGICEALSCSPAYGNRVIEEYAKFILIAQALGHENARCSKPVDEAWHQHILHTRHYQRMCEAIGFVLHHEPDKLNNSVQHSNAEYERTLACYLELFGAEAPRDIWYRPGDSVITESGLPDTQLSAIVRVLPRGSAVDLGSGDGRNALLLAKSGFDVVAVDRSLSGLLRTTALALENRLSIDCRNEDIQRVELEKESQALIVMASVLHTVDHGDAKILAHRIFEALKPGGMLYIRTIINAESSAASNVRLFPEIQWLQLERCGVLDMTHGDPHTHEYLVMVGQKPMTCVNLEYYFKRRAFSKDDCMHVLQQAEKEESFADPYVTMARYTPIQIDDYMRVRLAPYLSAGAGDIRSAVVEYKSGARREVHRDISVDGSPFHRSIVIGLDDFQNYGGGFLRVGDACLALDAGDIVSYCGGIEHGVSEITWGTRRVLVVQEHLDGD